MLDTFTILLVMDILGLFELQKTFGPLITTTYSFYFLPDIVYIVLNRKPNLFYTL